MKFNIPRKLLGVDADVGVLISDVVEELQAKDLRFYLSGT